MIIYIVRNLINGKAYIGQTIQTLESRWYQHKSEVYTRKSFHPIHCAIRKYGEESFEKAILTEANSLLELDRLEIELIAENKTQTPNGYNVTEGGSHPPMTLETREKLSKIRKGRTPWNKGEKNPYSKETLEKMSKSQQKRFVTGGINKGRIFSSEQCLKMSQTSKRMGLRPSIEACSLGGKATQRIMRQRKKDEKIKADSLMVAR